MQILSTLDLTKSYKGRKVVDDINLTIEQGEVVGLLGPNGAGKTTTFYIMVGMVAPDSGQVVLDGIDITNLPMYLRARNGISYLPQEPSIFRKLTVEENILAVLPASYRINLEKLSTVAGKPVALLEEDKCDKLFPDCEPGAVPPFGELYDMPVYLDQALAEDPEIIFSAGTRTDGVRMGSADFMRLAKPRVCSFAEKA